MVLSYYRSINGNVYRQIKDGEKKPGDDSNVETVRVTLVGARICFGLAIDRVNL